jgi:adenine-specific DNA-methyltransferase
LINLTAPRMMTICSGMILEQDKAPATLSGEQIKSGGIHYTPVDLARFLADQLATPFLLNAENSNSIRILDPACGDGELLVALVDRIPRELHAKLHISGFDTSLTAIDAAKERLGILGLGSVNLSCENFLDWITAREVSPQLGLGFSEWHREMVPPLEFADLVISNPPYVRTQVLGARESRSLAARFNLTGRVDLYHAFVIAMTQALRPGGFLGLLSSNRFLTTQSG